jgi:hypothetical protein
LALGSVLLDVNGSTLTGRNLRSNGAITDLFAIDHSAGGSTPALTTPPPASPLTTSSVTFDWTPGVGWGDFELGVGTSPASVANWPWGDIAFHATGANTSQVVSGVPLTGNPVYVRLWYKKEDGSWHYTDATYTAASTDTLPPSITLTAPTTGTTVSSPVTITATATDNMGVVGVQFHLNGTNFGAEDTTNTYSVSWDTYRGGPGAILVNRNCTGCCREFHDGHTCFDHGGRSTGFNSPERPWNPYSASGFQFRDFSELDGLYR